MSTPPSEFSVIETKAKAWFAQWPPWIAAAIGFGIGFLVAKIL